MIVSIVTYRTNLNELKRCIESLNSIVVSEIYIIDNSSDNQVYTFAKQFGCVYIPSKNIGYGRAHNIALKKSLEKNVDYHLVINPDVYFDPNVLERLTQIMDDRPDIGQIQPKILYPNGELQYSVRRLPTPFNVFGRRFIPNVLIRSMNDRYLLKDIDHNKEFNVAFHQGSFMLIRVNALKKIGLFDERYFMYAEDIDLTRRMHNFYKTVYYPKEVIFHIHRQSSYHSFKMLCIHIVNMIRYFNKWGWFFDKRRDKINENIGK